MKKKDSKKLAKALKLINQLSDRFKTGIEYSTELREKPRSRFDKNISSGWIEEEVGRRTWSITISHIE